MEGFGWEKRLIGKNNWGLSYKFTFDIFGGYEVPVFYVDNGANYAVAEPQGYAELANHFYV